MKKNLRITEASLIAILLLFVVMSCNDDIFELKDSSTAKPNLKAATTSASFYLTNTDGSAKFASQTALNWTTASNSNPNITVNKGTTYQNIDGFGFTLTEASAQVMSGMSSSSQSALLSDLFSTSGIGISVVRVGIGSTDLSASVYSYQEFASFTGSSAPTGSYIRLQGVSNSKWVTSNDGSSAMICDRSSASAWETFLVVDAGSGLVALQGTNGKYVTGSSPMYCNATSIGSAEKFSWVIPASGQVQLKCSSNNLFACSENGTASMNCNRASASGWETFNVQAAIFSLSGPDLTYTIPILRKILAINSSIKVLATPWSAPTWMKSNASSVGGNLQTAFYTAYATYFKKYLDAMKAQGITVWAITPQNEPENPYNNPSMSMTASEQVTFINNNLGPTIRNAGYSTKIIGFDHNCNNTSFPTTVSNSSSYVDGAAFHLYAGDISALTTVKNATGKNVYLTEQYTGSNGSFAGDFPWHMQNVMIGSMNNWAKAALEWNLAANTSYGPYISGTCSTCLPAVTINGSSYTKNVSYYIVAHMSKFVRPNAVRVNTTTTDATLKNVAFTSGNYKILVVQNSGSSSKTFNVVYEGSKVIATLKAGSAGTFVWQ